MRSTKFQACSHGPETILASFFFFRRLGHRSSLDECILFLESLEVLAASKVLALGVGNSKSNRLLGSAGLDLQAGRWIGGGGIFSHRCKGRQSWRKLPKERQDLGPSKEILKGNSKCQCKGIKIALHTKGALD